MLDVSFSELVVIAIVALIVIGPEKLPKVARTLGALVGRMQKFVAQVKEEVNRDVRFHELQELQQEIQENATKTSDQIQMESNNGINSLNRDVVNPSVIKESQSPVKKILTDRKKSVKRVAIKKVSTKE